MTVSLPQGQPHLWKMQESRKTQTVRVLLLGVFAPLPGCYWLLLEAPMRSSSPPGPCKWG